MTFRTKPSTCSSGADDIRRLSIDSLAFNGYGVGRLDGRVFFVPFTAPGDEIECRIVRERKNCFFAEITQILKAAPQRREPPCPAFGTCGGCHWQHLPYTVQTYWKDNIFRDMVQRRTDVPDNVFEPLAASPGEFYYRSRAQFKCRKTEQGLVMGFYRRGSHYVVDIEGCPLMAGKINAAFHCFRAWLQDSPFADRIPQIDISVDDNQKVRAVVHCLGGIEDDLAARLRPEAEKDDLSLFFQSGRNATLKKVCGSDNLHIFPCDSDKKMALAYGPGSFSQVNLCQNRRLIKEVVDYAQLTGKEKVLDLFCGVGNISLPLAQYACRVCGVEYYSPAVDQARNNAAENGVKNARFHAGCAEKGFVESEWKGDRFDVVVLDPPREGAYNTVKGLLKLGPEKIIYVSCDPATLARDLVPLRHHDYKVSRSRVLDFFPQTFHIESVTLLEKRR